MTNNGSFGRAILCWAAILLGLLCLPKETRAVATLRMSTDGGVSWTNVVDNGPKDSNPEIGGVYYNGNIGNNWYFASISGSSEHNSPYGPILDLNGFVASTGGGSLIVQYSDDGFGPTLGYFYSAVGGTSDGKVTFKSAVDPANSLFSGQRLMEYGSADGVYNYESNSPPFRLTNYSLTLEAVITHTNLPYTGFDLDVVPVTPSPNIVATLSNAVVCLSFPTMSGLAYGLEYKNNLSDNDWLPLQSAPGTDSTLTFTDAPPAEISRFYRVKVQ